MSDVFLSQEMARQIAAIELANVPARVVAAAKLHLLDSLGCILAGSRLEPGRLAYDLASKLGNSKGARVTLPGMDESVGDLDAAQAMATAAHCGELDDIHGGSGTCIGGMVIPSLVSLAPAHGLGGVRFLEAVVAGYETFARVGLAINGPALFGRGWWPSTVCGAFAVVAAGAKLLAWSEDKVVNALGIASLHAGGMLTGGQEGATARHLAFGSAARNGLLAMAAAETGLRGPTRALEDPRGFCLTLCAEPRWQHLRDWVGYHLPDVAYKPYPCARQLHAGVEALLRVLQGQAIESDSIKEIEIAMPTQNANMVNRPAAPTLRAATLGSGQYVMAVATVRGKIDLESFEEAWLNNSEVHALMARVRVAGSAELDRQFPKYWSGRVTLRLRDGSVVSEEVLAPKGESENPMTPGDIENKFVGLAAPVIGEKGARRIVEEVSSLDERESLNPLLVALGVVDALTAR